jgi:hypothetical protein
VGGGVPHACRQSRGGRQPPHRGGLRPVRISRRGTQRQGNPVHRQDHEAVGRPNRIQYHLDAHLPPSVQPSGTGPPGSEGRPQSRPGNSRRPRMGPLLAPDPLRLPVCARPGHGSIAIRDPVWSVAQHTHRGDRPSSHQREAPGRVRCQTQRSYPRRPPVGTRQSGQRGGSAAAGLPGGPKGVRGRGSGVAVQSGTAERGKIRKELDGALGSSVQAVAGLI